VSKLGANRRQDKEKFKVKAKNVKYIIRESWLVICESYVIFQISDFKIYI